MLIQYDYLDTQRKLKEKEADNQLGEEIILKERIVSSQLQ